MMCKECNGSGYRDRFSAFDIPCSVCLTQGTTPDSAAVTLLDDLEWLKKYLGGEPGPCAILDRARAVIAAQCAVLEAVERLREVMSAGSAAEAKYAA